MLAYPFVIFQIGLLAAASAGYWGNVPEDVRTFIITYSGDEGRDYGALMVDGAWVVDSAPELSATQQVTIIFDYPWENRAPYTTMFRNIQVDSEPRALRANRIEQGYKNAGYVLLRQDNATLPVLERDIMLAEQAAALAAEVAGDSGRLDAEGMTEYAAFDGEADARVVHPWYRWGAHGGVLLVTALALIGVYRRYGNAA